MEPAASSSPLDQALALIRRSSEATEPAEKLRLSQEAGACFAGWVAVSPDDPLVWCKWGSCLFQQSVSSPDAGERAARIAEGEAKFATAAGLPGAPEAVHFHWAQSLGYLACLLSDPAEVLALWGEAATHLLTVLSHSPAYPRARDLLVDCCFAQLELERDPEKKASLLRDATAHADLLCGEDPRISHGWLLRGRCLYLQAEASVDGPEKERLLMEAEATLKTASELDPDDAESFHYLGLVLEAQVHLPESAGSYEEHLRSHERKRLLASRAVDYHEMAHVRDRTGMNYCMSSGEALLLLAWFPAEPPVRREVVQRARQRFEAALELQPGDRSALFHLARSLGEQGALASGPAEARDFYAEAIAHYATLDRLHSVGVGTLSGWGRTLVQLAGCTEDETTRRDLENQVRDKFQRAIAKGDPQVALTLASFEASRDPDAALAALRHWRDHSAYAGPGSIDHNDRSFDPLRKHPEFIAIQASFPPRRPA